LSDFMMLIPRLGTAPILRRERIYAELRAVFRDFGGQVRFADLNLRLSLLWISVEASPGVIRDLAGAIRRRIPEAVLIGHECGLPQDVPPPSRVLAGLQAVRGLIRRVRRAGLRLGAPGDRSH
jgi:hypothetical protein